MHAQYCQIDKQTESTNKFKPDYFQKYSIQNTRKKT